MPTISPLAERVIPNMAENEIQPTTAVQNFGFTNKEISELSDENKSKIHDYIDTKVQNDALNNETMLDKAEPLLV